MMLVTMTLLLLSRMHSVSEHYVTATARCCVLRVPSVLYGSVFYSLFFLASFT